MKSFLLTNSFGIATFIIGIIVTAIFYFLQARKATSVYSERVKQSKKEIIDTIENYIINNKDISETTFINLKNGLERAYEVTIEKEWTYQALMQDISFRLQTSRHLATDQKLEYAKKLDSLIQNWSSSNKLSNSIGNSSENQIVKNIIELSRISDEDKKNELHNNISKLIEIRSYRIHQQYHDKQSTLVIFNRLLLSLTAGTITSAIFVLSSKIFTKESTSNIAKEVKTQPIIVIESSTIKQPFLISDNLLILTLIGSIILLVLLFKIIKSKQNKSHLWRTPKKRNFFFF
ncbi:hypothetical protein NI459_03100 [Acinetobacter schindleri]|uniref:hypothetical protein n=1 Tax=Acinetobacter schindleri TaxID=108981 RepID=UPI00209B976C|nr:hypothetical protein [Acinetobacter schindleri]MCO8066632.1 hypothetical protein [Acinetobacter schindleri]